MWNKINKNFTWEHYISHLFNECFSNRVSIQRKIIVNIIFAVINENFLNDLTYNETIIFKTLRGFYIYGFWRGNKCLYQFFFT